MRLELERVRPPRRARSTHGARAEVQGESQAARRPAGLSSLNPPGSPRRSRTWAPRRVQATDAMVCDLVFYGLRGSSREKNSSISGEGTRIMSSSARHTTPRYTEGHCRQGDRASEPQQPRGRSRPRPPARPPALRAPAGRALVVHYCAAPAAHTPPWAKNSSITASSRSSCSSKHARTPTHARIPRQSHDAAGRQPPIPHTVPILRPPHTPGWRWQCP